MFSEDKAVEHMGLVATRHVFWVSDKATFKPVSLATGTSQKIEISPVASLHMILSTKRITKALIRLRGCAGWSAPVLFTNPRRQVFSGCGPYNIRYVCRVTSLAFRVNGEDKAVEHIISGMFVE